jgi:hypothetical protein
MTTYIDPDGNEIDTPETQALGGERLLDDICDAISRYCILPGDHEYLAVTLWVAYTHLSDAFDFSPRLIIRSPEMRSGKTRLLEVISEIIRKPLKMVSSTPAIIFRTIHEDSERTLVLDEVDSWFVDTTGNANDNIRGLINAGFQRGATVWRMGGKNMTEPQEFNVFAPVAMAGIGRLPCTIEDRSVIVMMRRKAPHEKVDSYRIRRDQPGLAKLHDRLDKWSKEVRDKARDYSFHEIDMPVDDREADTWEPLIAVAECAGGNWPHVAREACRVMCAKADANDHSDGQLLLSDIREIFGADEFIRSSDLAAYLKNLPDSPWFDQMLTPAKLASRLRGYSIHPRHSADKSCRGYYRADFRDAWSRYLPKGPSEPSEPSDVHDDQEFSPDAFRSTKPSGTPFRDTRLETQPVRDTSPDNDLSQQNTSSEGVTDTPDDLDGSTRPPTPLDVANAAKIAKGKAIFQSGKYDYLTGKR